MRLMRPCLTALLLAATLVPPSATAALELDNLSDAERSALRSEIRSYLLENPEVIMEAVSVLEKRQASAQETADSDLIAAHADAIFNDTHSWVGGNPDGDITLVEFMDYRCGYCRRAAPEVNELVGTDGNIRFVIKEFPILGDQSVLASRFAIATLQLAGDEAYKSIHDALISFNGEISEPALRRLAETLNLDADAILARMDHPDVNAVIAANHQLARRLAISGTPTFVLQDRMLRGYVPLEAMQSIAAEIRADNS